MAYCVYCTFPALLLLLLLLVDHYTHKGVRFARFQIPKDITPINTTLTHIPLHSAKVTTVAV
jgi:hypothetical protein